MKDALHALSEKQISRLACEISRYLLIMCVVLVRVVRNSNKAELNRHPLLYMALWLHEGALPYVTLTQTKVWDCVSVIPLQSCVSIKCQRITAVLKDLKHTIGIS